MLRLGTDTQIALRLQKHKGMGISALHYHVCLRAIMGQNRLNTQICAQSQTPVLHIKAALSSLVGGHFILHSRDCACSTTYLPALPGKSFQEATNSAYIHLWVPRCVHIDLTMETLNNSVCNFLWFYLQLLRKVYLLCPKMGIRADSPHI